MMPSLRQSTKKASVSSDCENARKAYRKRAERTMTSASTHTTMTAALARRMVYSAERESGPKKYATATNAAALITAPTRAVNAKYLSRERNLRLSSTDAARTVAKKAGRPTMKKPSAPPKTSAS